MRRPRETVSRPSQIGRILTCIQTIRVYSEWVVESKRSKTEGKLEKNRFPMVASYISSPPTYLSLQHVRNPPHLPSIQYSTCYSSWISSVMPMILLLQCIAQTRHSNINPPSLLTHSPFRLRLIGHPPSHAKYFFVSDISFRHRAHAFFFKSAD